MQSFLGFADFSIAVIYMLNIGVVLFCIAYGWKAWTHSDKDSDEVTKDTVKWDAEEEKINSEF